MSSWARPRLGQGNKAQYQYSLRAVIVHSGGIHSGHYITYRKGPFGSKSANKWFYTSDPLRGGQQDAGIHAVLRKDVRHRFYIIVIIY
uniref:Ubiquitin carboxyl-terminal hydrolase 30 n=1 Tax=Paracalanus parvus TaxID=187406 RepID=A0A0U2UQ83_9MAXI|nr:ubiquitin carboxyl-terminal hydrolase 30 [Paracalanus parvus]